METNIYKKLKAEKLPRIKVPDRSVRKRLHNIKEIQKLPHDEEETQNLISSVELERDYNISVPEEDRQEGELGWEDLHGRIRTVQSNNPQ